MGSIVPTSLKQDLVNEWNNFDGINCLFGPSLCRTYRKSEPSAAQKRRNVSFRMDFRNPKRFANCMPWHNKFHLCCHFDGELFRGLGAVNRPRHDTHNQNDHKSFPNTGKAHSGVTWSMGYFWRGELVPAVPDLWQFIPHMVISGVKSIWCRIRSGTLGDSGQYSPHAFDISACKEDCELSCPRFDLWSVTYFQRNIHIC